MKPQTASLPLAALFLVTVIALPAEEKKEVPSTRAEKSHRVVLDQDHDHGPAEKVPTTYLGVETSPVGPTVVAQLGLPENFGLVVVRVMEDSPAASLLKEHDILTKFDDQLLVDAHQLSVLVRARKEGEEVPLTFYRVGKQVTLKAKLGQHVMPRFVGHEGPSSGAEFNVGFFNEGIPGAGGMSVHRLPGMEPDDVHNVLRMIGRERHNWFGAPPVHFFRREGGKDSTMLNLAEGNFVFSDDSGTVEVKAGEGKRELTVKNDKGVTLFHGPIQTAADRDKLPSEIMERLRKIENVDLNDEPGDDFEQETAIEPPLRTKISLPLNQNGPRARLPDSSF